MIRHWWQSEIRQTQPVDVGSWPSPWGWKYIPEGCRILINNSKDDKDDKDEEN